MCRNNEKRITKDNESYNDNKKIKEMQSKLTLIYTEMLSEILTKLRVGIFRYVTKLLVEL
jgi:hypothetical protein